MQLQATRRCMIAAAKIRAGEISQTCKKFRGLILILHNVELNDLYSSPNIVRVIKSRRIRLAEHVARKGREEVCTGFWWGNVRQRVYLEDPGVDGRMICSWSFRKWDVGVWTGSSWLRKGTGGGRL